MSASTDLCTRDSVKTYLGLSGSTYDDTIDALIDAASEAIEAMCGRQFNETTYTEYHDGGGNDRLVLKHRPVSSVTGLWDDLDRDFADASKLDSDDYFLDGDAGMAVLLDATFACGTRNVKVVYVAGYSTVPTDIAQACRMLVASWFHRGREGADGLDSRTIAETAQRFATEPFPLPVRRIVRSYREHTL